jgi:3-oxoacyl-[acyl-carrier protein] reductase
VGIPAERCGRRVEQCLYLRHVRLDRDGPRLLAETSEAMFDATFGRDGRCRIVTFSSSGVGSLRPSYSAYVASKVAVTPMMYTGKTEDDMERYIAEAPLGRLGMPEDIAPLVSFLASDVGHWVNAQVLRCNGGTIW